jgi:ATP-dependent Lon protease
MTPHPPEVELPDSIPVMVLPGCTLFPGCLLPLYIFEPRYREMLSYALENERFFCIGTARKGIDPETDPDPVLPLSTAGLVRACVTHDNGTSHLVLLGLSRIRITGWTQEKPFRIAEIDPVPAENGHSKAARELAAEVIDLAGRLVGEDQPMSGRLHDHLRGLGDASTIADVVAHNFVVEPAERQTLLGASDVTERLHLLTQHLQRRIAEAD